MEEAFQTEGRGALGHAEGGRRLRVQTDRLDGQTSARHADDQRGAEQPFERGDLKLRLDQRPVGVVHHVFQLIDQRHSAALDQAAEVDDRVFRGKLQHLRDGFICRNDPGSKQKHFDRCVIDPEVRDLLQAEDRFAHVECTHEGAFALGGGDEATFEKDVDGPPHGHRADAVAGAQLSLGGDLVARAVEACADLLGDLIGDCQIGRFPRAVAGERRSGPACELSGSGLCAVQRW